MNANGIYLLVFLLVTGAFVLLGLGVLGYYAWGFLRGLFAETDGEDES